MPEPRYRQVSIDDTLYYHCISRCVWLKYDIIVPIDWENDNAIPATAEIQFGKMHNKLFGYYADLKVGLGSDRPFDWGVGIGARFVY